MSLVSISVTRVASPPWDQMFVTRVGSSLEKLPIIYYSHNSFARKNIQHLLSSTQFYKHLGTNNMEIFLGAFINTIGQKSTVLVIICVHLVSPGRA